MRERWPLSIVGEGLRPARLAPPQVWAELPLKRCHAQAVRAAMLLRLRQEPPTTRAAVIRDPSNNFRHWPVGRNPGGDTVTRRGVDAPAVGCGGPDLGLEICGCRRHICCALENTNFPNAAPIT